MDVLEGLGVDAARAAEDARKAKEDEVGQNDFLQMLVAQLENQDPLNPQDSAAFASQLAQFSMVEQQIAMREGIDKLVGLFEADDGPAGGVDGASGLDPSQLVGREVVVFGSQIEVDEQRQPITLPLRTIDTAVSAEVTVYDENGNVRHSASILPQDEQGRQVALRPGDHDFVFDPAQHNLPVGTYAIEFTATGADGEPITVLPMVTGQVTGAILAGEPSIRMGSRVFPVADILEVRLGRDEIRQASVTRTGGGQSVAQAQSPVGFASAR
jgi:flagellar basal-body rod modification protein FlgD